MVNHRRLALGAVLLLGLAGCSITPPAADAEPETSASTPPDQETCVYLAGGAIDDATALFEDYSMDRESVELEDVQSVIERFETAADSASTGLSIPLQNAVTEFRAIETRLNGGDPLTPVQYEVIASSLDAVMGKCVEALE